MGIFKKDRIDALLNDDGLMNAVIERALQDEKVLQELVEEIADELSDILEESPEFRQKFLQAASKSRSFRKRLIEGIAKEVG